MLELKPGKRSCVARTISHKLQGLRVRSLSPLDGNKAEEGGPAPVPPGRSLPTCLFPASVRAACIYCLGLGRHSCHSHFLHPNSILSLGKPACPATLSLETQRISFMAFERCQIPGLTHSNWVLNRTQTEEEGTPNRHR